MRIAVQMDPIDSMVVERDTSLALMAEAQARGHEIWWFTPNELFFEGGVVQARARRVSVRLARPHYEAHEEAIREAGAFDVILIRQDPPFDMGYVSNTYLLERVPAATLVLNRPQGIRNIPEKLSTLRFPDLIPPTFVGRDLDALEAFAKRFDAVVLKPAFLAGGEGVIKARAREPDFRWRATKFMEEAGREPIIAQEFLPGVKDGDKRVFVLGGEAIGAVMRLPQGDDFRANLHAGGRAVKTDLDARDREIAAAVAPLLAEESILFAGLDVIAGRLTEINVTSPTLVRELARFGGADIPKLFWDRVEALRK
ncbi:MAG: glutathione synthase [Hydrogenophilaceae bacterium]|jgi:glutathione synthase|nr:glutathione synthase [Hydrogenophilaceae bacterium]